MNLIKIDVAYGVVSDESKKMLGTFFKRLNGGCLIELYDDDRVIALFKKATDVSARMEEVCLDDATNIQLLLKARLDLSMVYAEISSISSGFEGLHERAYHIRKEAEAKHFIHYKGTVTKASDNAANAFAIITAGSEKEKEIEFKRMYKKTKSLADGIEQKLNALAGIIKNAQNEKDRNI